MSRQEHRASTKIARQAPQRNKSYLDGADIVIVGNGIAGLTAAVEARRLAPDRRIAIITEQCHPTINTPALKQFASGKLAREQLLAYPAGTECAQRIHVLNARVEEIHAQEKYVSLGGGRGFGYGSLLIATGSTPTTLPSTLPGCDFDGVLTLHRLQNYLDLRRRLVEVREAVVIGGGAHAIETVMGLLHWGITVHWLIRSSTILPRMLDPLASEMVLERVRRAGAKVSTETEIIGIVGRVGIVSGVVTNQQRMIPCQLVLACTGTSPNLALAERCNVPMLHKRGILVDDQLRTNVRDIYAAGDVAALLNPQSGTYEPRAQWNAAVLQGRTAAHMMTGQQNANIPPFGVPWHATSLGELSMLTVGTPLVEGVTPQIDCSRGSYRRLTIVNDRLLGYLSLGSSQPDSLAIKRIIDEGLPVQDIAPALLKGNFDVRKYVSQQRSSAAHGMVTSGKLPALNLSQGRRNTDALLPVALGDLSTGHPVSPPGHPQGDAPTIDELTHPRRSRVGAGLAPALEGSSYSTTGPLHDDYELEEEICSFTGNLPAIASSLTPLVGVTTSSIAKRIIDSTLAPLPSSEPDSKQGNLWSYTGNTPALSKVRTKSVPLLQESAVPSRSLWSYVSKRKQCVTEGGR